MVVSFIVGIMVGSYLMVYVKYVNPGYVEQVISSATEYYKAEKASQEQIDKGIEGIRAMYAPFGQFTYGIGTTMMTGLLISLVVSAIMQRKVKRIVWNLSEGLIQRSLKYSAGNSKRLNWTKTIWQFNSLAI